MLIDPFRVFSKTTGCDCGLFISVNNEIDLFKIQFLAYFGQKYQNKSRSIKAGINCTFMGIYQIDQRPYLQPNE